VKRFLLSYFLPLVMGALVSCIASGGPVFPELWPAYLLNAIGYHVVFSIFTLMPLWLLLALNVKKNWNLIFVSVVIIWVVCATYFWLGNFTGVYQGAYTGYSAGFILMNVSALVMVVYFRLQDRK
jgi:hypothetical protein